MAENSLVPGTLEMLILRTLHEAPMHGYAIAQKIQAASRDVLKVEEGSLYPALQRLLMKGWVKAEWALTERNREARFYRLTPAGRKHFSKEVDDYRRLSSAIERVLRPSEG